MMEEDNKLIEERREKLKALPCKSIDWDKFEAQFAAAHPEFKLTLMQTYPDLSKMEQRICTLLPEPAYARFTSRVIVRGSLLSDRDVNAREEQCRNASGGLSFHQIAHADNDRVATAMIERWQPDLGVKLMAIAIMISTFGCNNGLILMGARLTWAMAHDGSQIGVQPAAGQMKAAHLDARYGPDHQAAHG